MSPDCTAVKRSAAVSETKFTALASPNTAAATARQKSASNPTISPDGSRVENATAAPETPQLRVPRAFTVSRRLSPSWVRVTSSSVDSALSLLSLAELLPLSSSSPQAAVMRVKANRTARS